MLTQHIALVPEADGVDASELARVSAALQKQVTRDLSPVWGIAATVDAFPYLEDVPVGYWPIIVGLGDLGSHAGVHIDRNGQPYALVQAGRGWSLAASRACLEMLVNPFENRTVSAPPLRSDQAPVEFLIEVCAPCEDGRHAYSVNGVVVSDFCTPAFFGTKDSQAERYSWSGALAQPLRLMPGGHITWYDPISDSWWLRSHWGENPVDTQIGAVDRKLFSVRELVQACAPLRVAPKSLPHEAFEGRAAQARQASIVRAHRLRSLLGHRLEADLEAAVEAVLLPRGAPATLAPEVPAAEAEIEILLEIEGDEGYDFEHDEPTLPRAPAYAVEPALEQSVRVVNERPPLPASLPASFSSGTAPALRGGAPLPRPARVPSMPVLSSLAPISMASMQETPSHRGRNQLLGGVVGVAGLLAILWAGRASVAGSASSHQAPARAALGTAPVVPRPAAVPAPAVPLAPAAAAVADQAAPARAEQTAEAQPVASAHVPTASHARHHASQSLSLPPPAPAASERAPSRAARDAIDDLIDTRR